MKITNKRLELEPKSTLYKEEAEAIIAVVFKMFNGDISDGSFLLYGKKDGEDEPQRIISFDFGDGPSKDCYYDGKNSFRLARETLEQDLKNVHEGNSSHISYLCGSPLYLTMKTTHGRFNCACFVGGICSHGQIMLYCAIAQALACMGKEDKVLQESCDHIFSDETENNHQKMADTVRKYIEAMFDECTVPEIAAWKKWHDENANELTLFFE